MNYVIEVIPKSRSFATHIWKEGGDFPTKESAEFQAKQMRKMKDLYSKVYVIPKPLEVIDVINGDGSLLGQYKVTVRTFEALNFPSGSKERKKLNEDHLTSEYLPDYKYCLKYKDGIACAYPKLKQAISAGKQLAGVK